MRRLTRSCTVVATVGCLLANCLTIAGAKQQGPSIKEFQLPTPNSKPNGITLGPDGDLWFTEAAGNKIGRISSDGTIHEFPIPTADRLPYMIRRGPDGNLWYTALSSHKIGRITPSGSVAEFPTSSDSTGLAGGPDGDLWFTEQRANVIGRITTTGKVVEYPIPTGNSHPIDIVSGPDGALWFTEELGNKVGRITTAGAIREYTVPTRNSEPLGITVGPDGALWFVESNGNKIGRITASGSIAEFNIPSPGASPLYITTGSDSAMWFTENLGNKIGRVTTSGTVREFSIPTANSGPVGLTNGPDGAIWFAEETGNKIGRITTAGVPARIAISAVRVEKRGAKADWDLIHPSLKQVTAGRTVNLAIYYHVTNAAASDTASVRWKVVSGSKTILQQKASHRLGLSHSGTFRDHFLFKAKAAGTYVVTGTITVDGRSASNSTRIAVIRGTLPTPKPVNFSYDRLQTLNAKGQQSTSFAVGDTVYLRATFGVQHLQRSMPVTIIRTYERKSGGGWEALGHPVTEQFGTSSNGTQRWQVTFVPSPLYSPQRIVVGITIGSTTRIRSATISLHR